MTREELINIAATTMEACCYAADGLQGRYPAVLLRQNEDFAREVLKFLGWQLSGEEDGEENESGRTGA
jgi:hypothetical protein